MIQVSMFAGHNSIINFKPKRKTHSAYATAIPSASSKMSEHIIIMIIIMIIIIIDSLQFMLI